MQVRLSTAFRLREDLSGSMLRRITLMLEGRLYEWSVALATLGLSFEILMWPETIRESAFHLTDDIIGSTNLAVLTFVIGFARSIALAFNGRSLIIGPYVRAACSLLSAALWSQFAYALYLLTELHSAPSPGFPFWVSFTGAEIYVGYRAMIDVRRIS